MVRSERVTFVYDDVMPVSDEIMAATGVRLFGDLLSGGQRLADRVTALSHQAGCGDAVHVRSRHDASSLRDRLASMAPGRRFLLLRSTMAPTAERDAAQTFLKKVLQLRQPVVTVDGASIPTGMALLDAEHLGAYLEAVLADGPDDAVLGLRATCETVPDGLGLVDLRDQVSFMEFLSGAFAVRHFNHIEQDRHVITKRSANKDKIRREARYHGLLPAEIRHFFVQPYGYQEDAEGASYRMRRLFVPDVGVQWVHRAFSMVDFERFLAQVTHFLSERPVREVGRDRAEAVAEELYVTKVRTRVYALLETDVGRRVDATLLAAGDDGIQALLDHYLACYQEHTRRRRPTRLVLTHGDLCFSNILYSQPNQFLALVDPRGAEDESELYSDAYYDVAKLSHSVLGGYDLVHAGLYRVTHGPDLELYLELYDDELAELQAAFGRRIEELGFVPRLLRLYEASLFLSLMALHIDAPKKVLAFALRTRQILAALSAGPRPPLGAP